MQEAESGIEKRTSRKKSEQLSPHTKVKAQKKPPKTVTQPLHQGGMLQNTAKKEGKENQKSGSSTESEGEGAEVLCTKR